MASHQQLIAAAAALALAACAGQKVSEPAAPAAPAAAAPAKPAAPSLNVPTEYYKLANGLRVVLSEDHSVPLSTVAVYYNIGFRIEPRDRTGFAHLFEHMMFQGSTNLGKMEFIKLVETNGGVLNGSTRFDFTNYYEVVPSNTLQTILWAEADRMGGLNITQANLDNQNGVVQNEVKVNVLNRPYGGFPWLDVPQYANRNWYNAHNFYGDLHDLDAATLKDVLDFHTTYYGPNNAVVVVAGDFEPAQARAWIEKYFSGIQGRPLPAQPDISEAPQTEERRASKVDALAPRPALAVAYHVPDRWTPEWLAFGVIDQLLLQGEDSLLTRRLVKERGYTDSVSGGINLLGNMYNYKGPMLWTVGLIHDSEHSADQILADFDATVRQIQEQPVSPADFERALTKMRSGFYNVIGSASRFGLVDLLASFALFDDDPARINGLDAQFRKVTPELIQQTARKYLVATNRTVLTIEPGQAGGGKGAQP